MRFQATMFDFTILPFIFLMKEGGGDLNIMYPTFVIVRF